MKYRTKHDGACFPSGLSTNPYLYTMEDIMAEFEPVEEPQEIEKLLIPLLEKVPSEDTVAFVRRDIRTAAEKLNDLIDSHNTLLKEVSNLRKK